MTDKQQNLCRLAALLLMATSLSGCNTWSRLTSIGKEPELAPIQNPVDAPGYQAVSMPMPAKPEQYAGANSLWKKGSSGFFQDQRAAKVGDIITVNIEASDNASMKNKTEQYRDDNEDTVNINTASKEELMTLPGIGESRADAVIACREEKGSFTSIEGIKDAAGIGDGIFNRIKDLITVN